MEKKCIIVGAGEFFEKSISVGNGDFVIAADGGYEHLKKIGITPNLLTGDFDSLKFTPEDTEIVELPMRKNDTDIAKAIKIALEKGFKIFHIYGGTGGRFDHTLANLQLLNYVSKRGGRAFLFGEDVVLTAVTDGKIEFDVEKKGCISVFAIDDTVFVTEEGLEYALQDYPLKNDFPLGVSNSFKGEKSVVRVYGGTVLVSFER